MPLTSFCLHLYPAACLYSAPTCLPLPACLSRLASFLCFPTCLLCLATYYFLVFPEWAVGPSPGPSFCS